MMREEILHYLGTSNPEEISALYTSADRVRAQHVGDAIHARALLNISNYCRRNCLYCGLRGQNRRLMRYRMGKDDILRTVDAAASAGYKTVLMQSGEDGWYSRAMIAETVRIIANHHDIDIALSLGERPDDDYRCWFDAGATRYLLKHETSDPALYRALHPGSSLDERIRILRLLKSIGYETGSGVMVGLPGQSLESIADDILLFRHLDIDMIGCGPYIYNPDAGLMRPGDHIWTQKMKMDTVLKITALNRIVTRDAMIPATTATEISSPGSGRACALGAGANVVMFDITPLPWKEHYIIYPREDFTNGIGDYPRLAEELTGLTGRPISTGYGRRNKP